MQSVDIELAPSPHLERYQGVIRIAVAFVFAVVGVTAHRVFVALYIALPVVAAIGIGSRHRWLEKDGPHLWRVISWMLQFAAYMAFLVEHVPGIPPCEAKVDLHAQGKPSVGDALLRLLTSIPSAFVLGLLSIAGGIMWVVSAVYVLVRGALPEWLRGFQVALLRWTARLVAYLASLTDQYPPFSLDTDVDEAHALHEPITC